MSAMKRKAQSLGVEYVADTVDNLVLSDSNSRIAAVKLRNGGVIEAGVVVNAAGTGCTKLAALAGVALPVVRKKRCIFVLEQKTMLPQFPMLINQDGLYIRPDGGHKNKYICGLAPLPEEDPDVEADDFDVPAGFFEDKMWPSLASRVPAFETVRVSASWAGHYAFNTIDHNLILGFDPKVKNLLLSNGCSGHGLMQSPAVGCTIAEILLLGKSKTIDLSRFRPERFAEGKPINETAVI